MVVKYVTNRKKLNTWNSWNCEILLLILPSEPRDSTAFEVVDKSCLPNTSTCNVTCDPKELQGETGRGLGIWRETCIMYVCEKVKWRFSINNLEFSSLFLNLKILFSMHWLMLWKVFIICNFSNSWERSIHDAYLVSASVISGNYVTARASIKLC